MIVKTCKMAKKTASIVNKKFKNYGLGSKVDCEALEDSVVLTFYDGKQTHIYEFSQDTPIQLKTLFRVFKYDRSLTNTFIKGVEESWNYLARNKINK